MPLAFDLISTLVMGVTLPVATTLFARSPFSTFASFVGSILVPPRVAATATTTSAITATATMVTISQRLFLCLPFATAPPANDRSILVSVVSYVLDVQEVPYRNGTAASPML